MWWLKLLWVCVGCCSWGGVGVEGVMLIVVEGVRGIVVEVVCVRD